MRIKWILPILIGTLLGATIPAESASTRTYRAYMLPPAGNKGEIVYLTCGWHTDSCLSDTSGNFLDWASANTKYVYFRGIFTRGSSAYETSSLHGEREFVKGGSDQCDIQRVYIKDTAGKVRGVMQYTHTTMNSTSNFPIATSSTGVYNSKVLGTMAYDKVGCAWTNYHVHAGFRPTPDATRYKNGMYPTGNYCVSGGSCYKKFQNDYLGNWTHYFLWSGL